VLGNERFERMSKDCWTCSVATICSRLGTSFSFRRGLLLSRNCYWVASLVPIHRSLRRFPGPTPTLVQRSISAPVPRCLPCPRADQILICHDRATSVA
jgi:hypothetical protein